MKPRTALQKAVVASSAKLPPLSDYQRRQVIKKGSIHIAKLDSKGKYVCLDCGHSWHGDKQPMVVCPECREKLKVDTSRKRVFSDGFYFALTRPCGGFQVVRIFLVQNFLRKGEKPKRFFGEAFQRWITPSGDSLIISRRRNWLVPYCDSWNWHSDLELRHECQAHSVSPYIVVGHRNVIPELKRNGFDGNFHDCSPAPLFTHLLTDNKVETLWKVGQFNLVRYLMSSPMYLHRSIWPSIRIALRHHYTISDAAMWCDMITMLRELGKDVLNPKFICPTDLQAAHDDCQRRVVIHRAKVRERQLRLRELSEEQRYMQDLRQASLDQKQYEKSKAKFFDLLFTDSELSIKPLVSVQEFIDEGRHHHHCVFSCKYYTKEKSLILHAMIAGKSVATIELNLENLEIIQCRGKFNSKPEQYDRIVALINKNKSQIAQRQIA